MNLLRKFRNRIIGLINWDLQHFNVLEVTKGSFIHSSVKFRNVRIKGDITIGEGCRITNRVKISNKSKVEIGRFTSINGPDTDIYCAVNPVKIGSFCSIARNVTIQEFNHKFDRLTSYFICKNLFNEKSENDIHSKGSIEIGNDVWIGTQCVILSGAKIGDGAVIAANSVVTGEIPPFAIAAGTPAKVLKYRFDEKTIQRIQELKWWDWSVEKIKMNKELFVKENFGIDDLIK